MCGIAAVVHPEGASVDDLRRAARALEHRGPDGFGYLLFGPEIGVRVVHDTEPTPPATGVRVGFAHRRLSIIDLSIDASQPMVDDTGTYALTYNGEVYNFVEIRAELESNGHRFRSTGDTEVVLRAYIEWGPQCVERFVGMWSLVILDLRRRVLFVSRDRFGVKPLFYTVADGGLWFASEIKALLEVQAVRPEVDEAMLATYLVEGIQDHSASTFFSGIHQVPPAHNATVSLDDTPLEPRFARYWAIPDEQNEPCSQAAIEYFRSQLTDAVMVHARSDVSVGTCLSGGIDSSGIVCLAEELRRAGRVPRYAHEAFGYVPEDRSVSERGFMEAVVRHTKVRMHYVEVSRRRFISAIPQIMRQQDEPVGSASIAAQWFVFERAHESGIKVMLDGQGADEVLAGYRHYNGVMAEVLLRNRRLRAYARFDRQHRARFGAPALRPRDVVGVLTPIRVRRALRRTESPVPGWLRADALPPTVARAAHPGSLHDLLKLQTESMNLPALLRCEDRNSMSHSIEARVPYLDHRLVESAFRLEDAGKLHGATSKYVLREALRGTIPETVRTRVDKLGFRADPGVARALAEHPDTGFLDAPTELERRWFRQDGLRSLVNESEQSVEAEFALWRVVNAKLWLRAFWG